MPGVDWIPGVSQLKSAFQLVTGDVAGAARTQENFVKECPIASQITSTVQLIAGDTDGALETQLRCLGTVNNVANGLPVIGHAKGLVHHAFGDHEGGNQALNAATRTSVILGTGAAAAVVSGGLAAIPAGIAAGSTYDLVDSGISGKPKGIFSTVDNAINNPDAGKIFDVAASFAGDGLAGYSGGQMGIKISTQAKLSSLEAARAAKNEQLNSALFPEDGGTGGSSSFANALGKEINVLTSEINNIQYGTPQYWYDVKTKQVVVEYPNGSGNVPFSSDQSRNSSDDQSRNRSERTNSSATQTATRTMVETGLDADIYTGEKTSGMYNVLHGLSKEQREGKILNYIGQKPSNQPLADKQDLRQLNQQQRDHLNNNDPERNFERNLLEQFSTFSWLHLQMPAEFNFTVAGNLNNSFQGFQHSFIRHFDQWIDHIPALRRTMPQLQGVLRLLETARNALDRESAGRAVNALNAQLAQLPDLRLPMVEAQFLIYRYMESILTSQNYAGVFVNDRGQFQIYFRVGNQYLVFCVSKELYPSVGFEFGDDRPVRKMITAFFISEDQFNEINAVTKPKFS